MRCHTFRIFWYFSSPQQFGLHYWFKSATPSGSAFRVKLPSGEPRPVKECQIQTPRAYVFGRVIKVIFDRADDVYVDVERKFAEALVRD